MSFTGEQLKHPEPRSVTPFDDVFTEAEAVAFLKLDGPRALRTLREKHDLKGVRLGKQFRYHRQHLISVAERLFGVNQQSPAGSRSKHRN